MLKSISADNVDAVTGPQLANGLYSLARSPKNYKSLFYMDFFIPGFPKSGFPNSLVFSDHH